MEPVTLTTGRLVLRPFSRADAEAVRDACQDPEIPRWTDVPSPYSLDDALVFIERIARTGWRTDTQYDFGVFTRDGGVLVGATGLPRLALAAPDRRAEIGFWTAREQRRRGYTAEAAREVARWAFTDLGVERLEWYAQVGNEASRATALRAGFRMEGTLRARLPHRGTRRDAWSGSLLPSDLGLPSATPYLPAPRG
ncbi:GNAT family N-acetyltransferase [Streptomyces gamaensis]|uniref:GNAT family N-acetyltransferase n=1 Tax=Streptomyces gamaensis TaxID=1763542 RepID=A0ABW0Z7V2_9ACTN